VDAVIEVDGLRKSYGDVEGVHGISFEVKPREIFGLIGVNGAGKTTTIEILEGYRSRDAGRVSVLGVDPAHADRAWRDQIGLVLQACELDPVHTVRETMSMFARYFRSPRGVDATIEMVGLRGEEDARVGELDGIASWRLQSTIEPTCSRTDARRRSLPLLQRCTGVSRRV
jgi:ABC-2 type transport system ATP-binding protein